LESNLRRLEYKCPGKQMKEPNQPLQPLGPLGLVADLKR